MIDNNKYLKYLITVRSNLKKFYNIVPDDILREKTLNYITMLDSEIVFYKQTVEREDKEFYSSLMSIYDFGA